MSHRVTWTPVVRGHAALLLDGRPVGIARYDWRKRLEVRFRFNQSEYCYRGKDSCRQAFYALMALVDTQEWMA
jgi:hypothetical protein